MNSTVHPRNSWSQLLIVVAACLAVLAAVEYFVARHFPVPIRREVADGVRDFRNGSATDLVLGSSHARTFHVLGERLAQLSGGRRQLVDVPLEGGKLTVMRWLLEHRIRPLLEADDAAGIRRRQALSRLTVIVQTYETAKPRHEGGQSNLPGRAWAFSDYLQDVLANGVNPYNRNYTRRMWLAAFSWSDMARARYVDLLLDGMISSLRSVAGMPDKTAAERNEQRLLDRHRGWTEELNLMCDPEQMAALDDIIAFGRSHNLEITLVAFPMMPKTLDQNARTVVVPAFESKIRAYAQAKDVRFVDLAVSTPLVDDDFMIDLDHLNAQGNDKFARWALDHDLAFLRADPAAGSRRAAR